MKVLLLVNIGRRNRVPSELLMNSFRDEFAAHGVEARVHACASPEDSNEALRVAERDGFESVWVAGGDGTLHHTLNAAVGRFDSFAVVPMGTINGLARALAIPRDPLVAIRWLLNGEPVSFDLGRVGDRWFALYATIGFHAAVFHSLDPGLKKALGQLAFWPAAFRELVRIKQLPRFDAEFQQVLSAPEPGTCVLTASNAATELGPKFAADAPPPRSDVAQVSADGYSLVLSNVENFAGFGAVREGDLCDSSFLQAHLFPTRDLWPMIRFFSSARFRQPSATDPGVKHLRVLEAHISSKHRLRVQVDGEPIPIGDDRELTITSVPNAMKLILNRGAVTHAAANRDASWYSLAAACGEMALNG